jgi:DNA-binding winged helix-turn-helix (wHTH) protein/tetratricopeptide (TPR) repeat protein
MPTIITLLGAEGAENAWASLDLPSKSRQISNPRMADISFGPFSLDTSAIRLLRQGTEVKLRPQAFHALRVLAFHSGRYVDYECMIAEAWSGTVVSPHTIDVTVGEVRRTLQEYGSWIRHRPKVGYCLEVPKSDELIRRGWHLWNLRTRDGFEKALECFQGAAAESPTDFRAYEGQSSCYLMLASYAMRPGRDVYKGFLDTHARAESLIGLTPGLRCNRAQGLHLLERRLAEAEAEFLRLLEERPTFTLAHIGLTMLYSTLGRLDDALDYVNRAYATDPLLPILPATEVSVRFWRREFDQAVVVGAKAVELHPYVLLGRAFYAQALEFSGRLDEALAQYQQGSVTCGDLPWTRALEGVCLVKLHREDEAGAMLSLLEKRRQSEHVDAYSMMVLRHALGQTDEAFVELERAIEERSVWLYALDVDPKADALRSDPRFARLRQKVFDGCF